MRFDHFLIMTNDLQGVAAFFTSFVGLVPGWRAPFPFPGIWLYAADQPVVHLAQTATAESEAYLGSSSPAANTFIDHIAFAGDDAEAFLDRLAESSLPHFERFVPETNEHQIFVTAPGGLKLEFIFR